MTSCIDLLNNLPTQERAETQASGTAKNTVSATRLNSKSSIIKSHLRVSFKLPITAKLLPSITLYFYLLMK